MSVPAAILSVVSEAMLKGLGDLVPNKAISVDAMLKAHNIELYKDEAGNVAQRPKKAPKGADKGVAKAEKAAKEAASGPVHSAEDEALLAPVDAAIVSVAVANKPHQDAYSDHSSRLKTLDLTRCMGRRIAEDSPLVGTRKGDAGANCRFFPELQCVKKPKEGKLCATCLKLEALSKESPTKPVPRWYGRLDEPLYWDSYVVGCTKFFTKYPNGIASDPSTAPKASQPAPSALPAAVPAPSPAAVPAAVPAPAATKPEKPKAKRPKKAEAPVEESVAVESAAKECEWAKMVYNGMNLVRNLKNGNVYQANTDFSTPEEMVLRDKFEGRWVDGDLDSYAVEVDE